MVLGPSPFSRGELPGMAIREVWTVSRFLLPRRKVTRRMCPQRRLRAEALEDRMLLAPVAALPFSVVLLDQPSTSGLPPDPCIQFSPQPLVSAATSNTAIHWQGHFSERLQDSPSATASVAAPSAWLVDVAYNLSQRPSPTPVPLVIVKGGYNFYVSGTARETLTPLDAAGNPIASAQIWVSNDKIQSQVIASPGPQMNPLAGNFVFSTDTTVNQTMMPVVAAATASTATQSWIASTTTHTTGTISEAPSLASGSLSLNEQISQKLRAVDPASRARGIVWTIDATFDGGGTFQETVPPTARAATAPSGTLALTGVLSGSISPPPWSTMPVRVLGSQVKANVAFSPK